MAFKKRNLLILILFISNFFYCAILRGTPPGGNPAEVFVVVVSSLQRVLQDEVDISGAGEAEVFCAKGESESFQIIVANDTGRDLPDIDLRSAAWRYVGDKPVGAPVLQMFREHYVEVKRSSGQYWKSVKGRLRTGMYPDALIPFVNPYTGKRIAAAKYLASGQNVKADSSQGYWVDISIGRDVKAGVYINEITVLSAGKEIAVVPVKVTVWDFELPEIHRLKTFFEKLRYVYMYHGLSWNDIKREVINKRYLLMLRDHGISLPLQAYPKVNHETGEVSFTPQYVKMLKAFTDEIHPSLTWVILPYYSFTKDPVKRARYLSLWEEFIRQNPWIPEPIVYIDEPKSREDYLKVIEYGEAINAYAPSIKLLVTEQIRPERPDYPSLEGAVDIWVPTWNLGNPGEIKRRQEAGDEVWSYSALVHEGVPNWLIDFPLVDYRIPAWFSWSLDLKGILYWQTTAWSGKNVKIDPWVDCQTYFSGDLVWNGCGSLVYPGAAAGIDGPVASMRLKVFRDSIEDFDYFAVLAKLVGRDEVNKIVEKVASSFRVYSKDINGYFEARRLIAEKIIKNKK